MLESIRITVTNLSVPELERLLKKVESQVFQEKGKRISGVTLADPDGPDAGHNLIVIDDSANPPPIDWVLREFPTTLTEDQLASQLLQVERDENKRLRCYGNVLVDDRQIVVALFDPVPMPAGASDLQTGPGEMEAGVVTLTGKMSTFGGLNDEGLAKGENLAWIDDEIAARAYHGFFLPPQAGIGWARRLRTEKFYLACRWDYSVTPKRFLAQPTTLCKVTNPRTGQSVEARPIDWGPHVRTGRVTDLSPGVADALGLKTDDVCTVAIPTPDLPPRPPRSSEVAAAISDARRVVFLTGDYGVRPIRQRQAVAAGCALTVDFHFNSNGPAARGAEVYFRTNHNPSKELARRVIQNFQALGLPDHGDPLKSATDGEGRAAFINRYQNTAILLEPLFVSNLQQAQWLHEPGNLDNLARAVADAIRSSTNPADVIGLSIGHLGKDSSPSDRGAPCKLHDMEATHGEAMARAVAQLLEA